LYGTSIEDTAVRFVCRRVCPSLAAALWSKTRSASAEEQQEERSITDILFRFTCGGSMPLKVPSMDADRMDHNYKNASRSFAKPLTKGLASSFEIPSSSE
jgi:hypothetical protein